MKEKNRFTEENDLIEKAVRWSSRASNALRDAGGDPVGILKRFPQELLVILVRNNIDLSYTQPRPVVRQKYEIDDEDM